MPGCVIVWVAIDPNGADMALAKLGAKATDEVMIRNHTIECHRDEARARADHHPSHSSADK